MSAALEELDKIMAEPNERIRLGLYRAWKSHAIARVNTVVTYDRLTAIQMGEKRLMEITIKDAVMKLSSIIVGESALSYVQMPVLEMGAMRVNFRCDILKERT